MRTILCGAVIVVSLILQSTLLPLIAVDGLWPDLLLISVVSLALLRGKEHGVIIGFCAGLLQDLAGGNMFGVHTLSKLVIGYLFGMAERHIFKENLFLPLVAVTAATLLSSVLGLLIVWMLGQQPALIPSLLYVVLPLVVCNVIITVPVHQVIYRIDKFEQQ